jgi:hypothetical protein
MKTLDQLITEAAREGRLKALTLWPSGKGWQANARNQHDGWVCISDIDPVAGLRAALTGRAETPPPPAPPKNDGGVFD